MIKILSIIAVIVFVSPIYAGKLKVHANEVEGQAFLKTRGGDVKRCSGEEVVLFDANDYDAFNSQNRYKEYLKRSLLKDSDPLYSEKTIYDELLKIYPDLKNNIPSYRIYERSDLNSMLKIAIERDVAKPVVPFKKLIYRTVCDANGDFKFDNIPDGSYIAATVVQWIVGDEPQGGTIYSDIIAVNPKLQKIFITK